MSMRVCTTSNVADTYSEENVRENPFCDSFYVKSMVEKGKFPECTFVSFPKKNI